MNIKQEHIIIGLVVAVVAWFLYKNCLDQKNESFCVGPECGVLESYPFHSPNPKYWQGRDHQQKWGDDYYVNNGDLHHPSNPGVSHYDHNVTPQFTNRVNKLGGCAVPEPPAPVVQPIAPEIPTGPLSMGCPSCSQPPYGANTGTQLADFPLPENHEDVNLLPHEGAPIEEIESAPQAPQPETQNNVNEMIVQAHNSQPIAPGVQSPNVGTNGDVMYKIKSAIRPDIIIAIIVGILLYRFVLARM